MSDAVLDIDLEHLAEPLSADHPCGIDPRSDASPQSLYYQLKGVRTAARAAERNAMVDNEPFLNLASEWNPILDQIPEILLTTSRDLELAAWLIEALARRHGFKGLQIGFDLATTLIANHWNDLYPCPDEDGPVTRITPLIGLNGSDGEGTLMLPIACIPLTPVVMTQAYSLWEYEQASDVERMDADKKKKRYDAGAVRMEDIETTVKATDGIFFNALLKDIEAALAAWNRLVAVVDQAMGEPQPSSNISRRLNDCVAALKYLAADKLAVAVDQETTLINTVSADDLPEEAVVMAGQLHSRAEAISQLKVIADFFKHTEPHSPMAYAIEQVVRWSGMALPDLLHELIADNDARKGYFRLTGIADHEQD